MKRAKIIDVTILLGALVAQRHITSPVQLLLGEIRITSEKRRLSIVHHEIAQPRRNSFLTNPALYFSKNIFVIINWFYFRHKAIATFYSPYATSDSWSSRHDHAGTETGAIALNNRL